MKAISLLVAAAAFAMPATAFAKIDLDHADVSHLPNGLTVILLEDHSFPLVSAQALYKSGSAAEITGKTGLAHFLEHLAFRGSQNFPHGRATELIYDAGGEWHGYTAMDQTTYFSTMPTAGFETLLKIEADRMARTVIDPASIDAEKGAVVTELHSYENDPAGVLQDAVVRTALQSHPYGSPMAGYVSDVERLTIDDARSYYASHYAPGNAVLAVVGDFDLSRTKAMIARAFADVPARAVAKLQYTAELPQRGERRIDLNGPVERQYFQLAYPAPAATSPDFPAFLLLQQILAGTPGLNPRQSGWTGTAAVERSLLSGASDDIATWLPATHDPFLFMISGSIDAKGDRASLEREVSKRIAGFQNRQMSAGQLVEAKDAVVRILDEDVLTTEDAAHQLAFFEGLGALGSLLELPRNIQAVSAADLRRVANTYLSRDRLTVGWMMPGGLPKAGIGDGNPKPSPDRLGLRAASAPAGQPQLLRLASGMPAIVQVSRLSDTVTVQLLMSGPVSGGIHPDDLPGLDAIVRSGRPSEITKLIDEAVASTRAASPAGAARSEDPETRVQQLILDRIDGPSTGPIQPVAIVVTGNIDPASTVAILNRRLGQVTSVNLPQRAGVESSGTDMIRDRIAKPLSQGGIGYVVEGPAPGTREALIWQMLLYVFTHDYSGRLGRSAITDKGLVYHIYSSQRTDGHRTWATISTGVDPKAADAMQAELQLQLKRLANEPPTATEVESARNHLLGRDLTAAQSNDELAAKLTREFVETGGLRSHEQLSAILQTISPADLADAAKAFGQGTIIRVDVGS